MGKSDQVSFNWGSISVLIRGKNSRSVVDILIGNRTKCRLSESFNLNFKAVQQDIRIVYIPSNW